MATTAIALMTNSTLAAVTAVRCALARGAASLSLPPSCSKVSAASPVRAVCRARLAVAGSCLFTVSPVSVAIFGVLALYWVLASSRVAGAVMSVLCNRLLLPVGDTGAARVGVIEVCWRSSSLPCH